MHSSYYFYYLILRSLLLATLTRAVQHQESDVCILYPRHLTTHQFENQCSRCLESRIVYVLLWKQPITFQH